MKTNLQFFARADDYPEAGLQNKATFANLEAKSIDYTYRFGQNFSKFLEVLNITRQIPVQEGFTIKMYGAPTVTLADGNVAEGELIPLSTVVPQPLATKEILLKKYRKVTSMEAIGKYGRDEAINKTDDALVREVQKAIRTDLFNAVKATGGTTQLNLNAGTLQGALASAWGALEVLFEDDAPQAIAFVNPMDVAKEIANKNITLETQFGLRYYTDATGTVVMLNNTIPAGTIYATVADNLQVAYVPSTSEAFREFSLISDEFGYVGMAHSPALETLTTQTVLASGVLIFPERLDGMVKVEIGTATPEV